jgi:hypothetical protein
MVDVPVSVSTQRWDHDAIVTYDKYQSKVQAAAATADAAIAAAAARVLQVKLAKLLHNNDVE